MIKKLTKHGGSWALVIDQPVLDLLKISPDTLLEVRTDGQTLLVTPAQTDAQKDRFQAALDKTNHQYGRALKRLAE
jgi:antitoxin MazE